MPAAQSLFALGSLAVALTLPACRDASSTPALAIVPNANGSNGCSGPDQIFTAPQTPVAQALVMPIGPASQVTAAGSGEILYATGSDASVVQIDFTSGAPVETVVVPSGTGAGTVAALLQLEQISAAPSLSGIGVLDPAHLIVVEQTSNTLIVIQLVTPPVLAIFAGRADETPSLVDGEGGEARFSFGVSTQVCPTGGVAPKVLVCDAGNHAVRLVQTLAPGVRFVTTLAGNGSPGGGSEVEDLSDARFDTPTGLSVACNGSIIVSELGSESAGGHRLRQLEVGQPSPFGGFFGSSIPLVGDGTAATAEGDGTAAQVSGPVSPLVTEAGEIYWIDSGSGVLRRMTLAGFADCPLAASCAPSFPAGHAFSLTQTRSGVLYVLDATDGELYRVTPP